MSIGTLRFKQLLTGNFDGDGFYVKYGSFPGLQIETQSPQYIIDNIVNNPSNNWAQNTTVSVPTYKSDVNKIKVELPLDYISSNPNFKNIVLYVLIAGELSPYAISETIPENMKSKNVDILSIYFTMPSGQNLKGIGSNRIALPEGINEFPLVASEGSWATKIFYEELRDSIPLGLPTGKNGVFYDDNARVTDLRVPSSGNSGGGINIEGGGSEIELSGNYRHSARNTPGGSEEKAFTEKGAQSLYGETALIEGKHWEGTDATDTTYWSGSSPVWVKKQLTHLKALNMGIGEDLPAPESIADLYRRLAFNSLKREQGVYHIIKPVTLGDIISITDNPTLLKEYSFKKRDFFPNYLGNIQTFVDDLDTENIHLPGDFDYELNGANVVDASLTLINENGYFQTVGTLTSIIFHHEVGGGDVYGLLEIDWNKEKLRLSILNLSDTSKRDRNDFKIPVDGIYKNFDNKSIIGYITLHVAKRFFFLSDPNSIYRWNPPKIETVKFQTSVTEREVLEIPGSKDFKNIKTTQPFVVEFVKLSSPHNVVKTDRGTYYTNNSYSHLYFLNDLSTNKVVAENTLEDYIREGVRNESPGFNPGGKTNVEHLRWEYTWSPYEPYKEYYGIKIYVDESILSEDYDIIVNTPHIKVTQTPVGSGFAGGKFSIDRFTYQFKKSDSTKILDSGESANGFKLITTSEFPSGVFPVAIPAVLKESNLSKYATTEGEHILDTITQSEEFVKIYYKEFYRYNMDIVHKVTDQARVRLYKDLVDPKTQYYRNVYTYQLGKPSGNLKHLLYSNMTSIREIELQPEPPKVQGTKKKIKETTFEGEFRLLYGSTIRINRINQISINNEVVGSIPDNVTNNGTFTVTNLVNNYRTTHPGNLRLAIGVSGETIFGNTIDGVGFSGDIILS